MVRSTLMSGELGSHHSLPVTIVATTTLADLQNKTGVAYTAGGTVLPIKDVLQMAAHAYNYLLVFSAWPGDARVGQIDDGTRKVTESTVE